MATKPRTYSELVREQRKQLFPEIDFERQSAAKRGYGRRWQAASRLYLQRHPLCVPCTKENRTRAATCVDHIIDHKGDMILFWDRTNWQASCIPCNSRKAARENPHK